MWSFYPLATLKQTSRLWWPGNDGHQRQVWIVNQYAVAADMPGITRHVELGTLLADQGWRTTIFATAFHHTTASLRRGVSLWRPFRRDEQDGVLFLWLYSTRYRKNGWKRYLNMVSFTAMMLLSGAQRQPPDIVIGSSPHLLAGLGAWAVARRYRVPFLFEVRDMWPDMLVQLGLTSRAIIKPLELVESFLYGQADRVIALTEGIADRIEAKGVARDKVVVIPNAILQPKPLDAPRRIERRRELGWDGKVVAVWAGSENPMNGLDIVVEAARILRNRNDIRIVFIGDGSLRNDLMEQSKGLPNVEFRDPVARTEIGDWLRAADLGLVHSRKFEVFEGARPNKLFEYMAAGLPIACTVPGEAWRLIEEAGAGVYAPWEDPGALAEAIVKLADSSGTRQEMGLRGFAYVSQWHSREATASSLAQVLDEARAAYESRHIRGERSNETAVTGDMGGPGMPYGAYASGGLHAAD